MAEINCTLWLNQSHNFSKEVTKTCMIDPILSVFWPGLTLSSRWAPAALSSGLHLLLQSDGGDAGPPEREGLPQSRRGEQPVPFDYLHAETPPVWWWETDSLLWSCLMGLKYIFLLEATVGTFIGDRRDTASSCLTLLIELVAMSDRQLKCIYDLRLHSSSQMVGYPSLKIAFGS